jgi:hypothetical protein
VAATQRCLNRTTAGARYSSRIGPVNLLNILSLGAHIAVGYS